MAKAIPLFKRDLGNYRPLSSASLPGKRMEAIPKSVIDRNMEKIW